jgi:hypothetical protein
MLASNVPKSTGMVEVYCALSFTCTPNNELSLHVNKVLNGRMATCIQYHTVNDEEACDLNLVEAKNMSRP